MTEEEHGVSPVIASLITVYIRTKRELREIEGTMITMMVRAPMTNEQIAGALGCSVEEAQVLRERHTG